MENPAELDLLMKALAEGDRAAFTPVFRRLWVPTLKLCRRLVGDRADADDVAQTTMLRLLERAHEYDAHRPALPWAMGVAAWECRTQLRRRERRKESSEEAAPVSDDGATVRANEQRALMSAALEALGTLSELDQRTLVDTYWETGAPVAGATLRKRRERALTRLRQAFRRLYGPD